MSIATECGRSIKERKIVMEQNKQNKKGNGCLTYIIIVVLLLGLLSMCSGGGSGSGDRTCAWCNGTGYSGNGAKNAVEYVMTKTPCKHCNGSGHY